MYLCVAIQCTLVILYIEYVCTLVILEPLYMLYIYRCISDYINVLSHGLCMPMPFQPSNQRTCIKQRGMAIQLHCCTSIVSFFWIFTSLVVTHTQLRCLPKGILTLNNPKEAFLMWWCAKISTYFDHWWVVIIRRNCRLNWTKPLRSLAFSRVLLRSRESPNVGDQT